MYNFDSCNVLLAIATNISVLLMTAFVLQSHRYAFWVQMLIFIWWNSDACNVNQWNLYNSTADTYDINISRHSISPIIKTYNAMLIERWRNKRSSEDVRWRSFLRWGTVKVKLLETNAPQKILKIRFETNRFF